MTLTAHSVKLIAYDYTDIQNLSYNNGDIIYDNTNRELRIMDGRTPGGWPIATQNWVQNNVTASGVLISSSQPTGVPTGQLWFDSNNGSLYIYLGSQWVQPASITYGTGGGGGSVYVLPPATTSVLGGVIPDGTTITVNSSGVISAVSGGGSYSLTAATTSALGGVIIPAVGTSGITNTSGTIGLATASTTQLGGVKVDGSTITISNGIISSTGGSTYTLPQATTSVLGGVKVDGTTITSSSGTISANLSNYVTTTSLTTTLGSYATTSYVGTAISNAAYSLPTASTTQLGGVKVDGSTITISGGIISAVGATYGTRSTVATTTASISYQASATATVTTGKGYVLYSIQVSAGAWVVVYSSSSAQSSDSSRSITTDPTPGSGVLAEAITTTATTTYFSPAIYGYNNDGTVSANTYLKIYNNSSSSAAITVTLTYLRLE